MSEHIPAPAEHAPRKESRITGENRIMVEETQNVEAWIEGPAVTVTQ